MKVQQQVLDRWEKVEHAAPSPEPETRTVAPAARPAARKRTAATSTRVALQPAVERAQARTRFLSADGQRPTDLEREIIRGTNDLVDVNFVERCLLVSKAVGRIEAPGDRGLNRATGFLVAPGLMMTNHHVLPSEDVARNATVEFGFRHNVAGELESTTRFAFAPETFFVADEELDYAVVAVAPSSATERASIQDFGYLRLHPETGKVREKEFVTIIQHPDGLPMRIALRENQVTQARDDEFFIKYEADTAHGSSGAPVFNDSFQVAALHASGKIKRAPNGEYMLRDGTTTPTTASHEEVDFVWESNFGIRISRIAPHLLRRAEAKHPRYLSVLEQALAGGDILARAVVAARTGTSSPLTRVVDSGPVREERESELDGDDEEDADARSRDRRPSGARAQPAGIARPGRSLALPLTLHLSLDSPVALRDGGLAGTPRARGSGPMVESLEREAWPMQLPVIYDGLDERKGFDRDFLKLDNDVVVERPRLTAKGKKVAAPLLDSGDFELKYHKFSVVMHKTRRMALLTAANVDWSPALRKVNGRKPSRTELSEIPPNTIELWTTDERIDARHQLPDRFYTDDGGAFDKGHLVRRDDVCWGTSFEDIQMANGDTYHTTNCSPQISTLNQAARGDYNWGDFEGEIQRITKSEKIILFSGPVLESKDRWFRGSDDDGALRLQVPRRFWKIVVAKGENGPEAFGFIFEQDVRAITEVEFAVSADWVHAMVPIKDIKTLLRGWVNLSSLEAIDQYDREQG